MRVELIDWTGKGTGDPWYAAALLIFTKNTRVTMKTSALDEITSWDEEKKTEELRYMSRTIPSSWEFVDYTFVVSDVTRAFTHQVVRTRTGSYAQQNLSVQVAKEFDARVGPSISDDPALSQLYEDCVKNIQRTYDDLVKLGAKVEDARGLLPTNILNNIVIKWDLRTCCETFRKRASSERGHGEYHEVIALMKRAILEVHPWAIIFLERGADLASREAYELISRVEGKELRMNLSKAVDEIMTRGD